MSVISRFWDGRGMPAPYVRFGYQWVTLNPSYHLLTLNARDVGKLLSPELKEVVDDLYARDAGRRGIELYVQLADIAGYVLVEHYGGLYVNCDIEPLRPLPEMPNKAWASYENHVDGRIVNAAIGAPEPHDPFWAGLLEELPARYWANPTAEMVETTGPAFLTDYAHAHPDQIEVLPVEAFNPVHWGEIELGGDASGREYPPESIGVHHWGHKKDQRTNYIETATQ